MIKKLKYSEFSNINVQYTLEWEELAQAISNLFSHSQPHEQHLQFLASIKSAISVGRLSVLPSRQTNTWCAYLSSTNNSPKLRVHREISFFRHNFKQCITRHVPIWMKGNDLEWKGAEMVMQIKATSSEMNRVWCQAPSHEILTKIVFWKSHHQILNNHHTLN